MKSFFLGLRDRIRKAYAGLESETRESLLLQSMGEKIERFAELFSEGLADAGERYAAAESKSSVEMVTQERDQIDSGRNNRTYSYNELIKKDDITGRISTATLNRVNGKIDIKAIVNSVKQQANPIKVGNNGLNYYYLVCKDIDGGIEITKSGIEHSINSLVQGRNSPHLYETARIICDLQFILQNTIEVNRSDRRDNIDVSGQSILLGVGGLKNGSATDYYAVKIIIQNR